MIYADSIILGVHLVYYGRTDSAYNNNIESRLNFTTFLSLHVCQSLPKVPKAWASGKLCSSGHQHHPPSKARNAPFRLDQERELTRALVAMWTQGRSSLLSTDLPLPQLR